MEIGRCSQYNSATVKPLLQGLRSYTKLQTKPCILRSFSGLSLAEFEALLPKFEQAWQEHLANEYRHRDGRQRRDGGGRKAEWLGSGATLVFILFYCRHYPTQAVPGFLFGIGQAQANGWVHRLTRVLHPALGYEQQLPERNPHTLEQVLAACPELAFVVDGPERRLHRPQDKENRTPHDSGKQKATTVKNNVITPLLSLSQKEL